MAGYSYKEKNEQERKLGDDYYFNRAFKIDKKDKKDKKESEDQMQKLATLQEVISQYKNKENSPYKRAAMFRYISQV